MSTNVNIDDIDFTGSPKSVFEFSANLNLEQLNWTRGIFFRVEADANYPNMDTIWIRVDKYPRLSDNSSIVTRNGRYYETTISIVRGSVILRTC